MTTTFILSRNKEIFRRTGGIIKSDNHVVQGKHGFTVEMRSDNVLLIYKFDHNKYAGEITDWRSAEIHIRSKFPEYFI